MGSIKKYSLVFDEEILKQLKKAGKDHKTKEILSKMMNRLEIMGPYIAKLIDSHLHVYEMKTKHPPVRMYFKHKLETDEIYLFEYEMKTSEKKQKDTIKRIKRKSENLKS
jgi:hypothetical protein